MNTSTIRLPQFYTDTHKQCSTCRELKLFSDFYKDSRNKKGNFLTHSCSLCISHQQKSAYVYSNTVYVDQVVTDTHKSCTTCREIKPFVDFHKDKKNTKGKGLCYVCKSCANAKSRTLHRSRGQDVQYKLNKKSSHIKSTYGISLTEYNDKLTSQNFKCGICSTHLHGVNNDTHLDHDHSTGKLRAFLCGNCNRGLGSFKDNKEFLMEAIHYLETHTDNGNQKEVMCL